MGEQIVVIVVRMAQDGAMSQPPIVQHALAASTPQQMLHNALAMGILVMATLLMVQVAVASGATIGANVAMMVRVGVISRAPIVQRVQDGSMAVLHRQCADEIDSIVLLHASLREKSSLMWHWLLERKTIEDTCRWMSSYMLLDSRSLS